MSFQDQFEGKKVVVWGLGTSGGGVESAKYFSNIGALVKIVDIKIKKELASSIEELKDYPNITYVFGSQKKGDLLNSDLIIKNPDIPWKSDLVKNVLKKGGNIQSDISIFFKNFPGIIIGVTGTKGKTTTTTLIAKILEEKYKVLLGGNLKVSLFSFMEKEFDKNSLAVLELSSFQTEDLKMIKKSPRISLVTNILRDHLNKYEDMEEYIKAKKAISDYQTEKDYLFLNYQDKNSQKFESLGNIFYFSSQSSTFQKGVYLKENKVFLKMKRKKK